VKGEAVPRSQFHRELSVSATPEESWAALTDVPRLVGWVSVVEDAQELEPLARYTAVLMDRLGPFKLRADLDIVLSDVEVGRSLAVKAQGEDRQVGSRLVIDATLSTAPRESGGTTITVDGVYEVTGKAASMGPGTINKKAEKIMAEFFTAAGAALGTV
jgi:carbon monoxide dehydrogenase subunit G